jgi:hypothetical protein
MRLFLFERQLAPPDAQHIDFINYSTLSSPFRR